MESVGVQRAYAFGRADQADVGRAGGEEAVGDHADDLVETLFKGHRVDEFQTMHVEDDVAVVGDEAFAQAGVPPRRASSRAT